MISWMVSLCFTARGEQRHFSGAESPIWRELVNISLGY